MSVLRFRKANPIPAAEREPWRAVLARTAASVGTGLRTAFALALSPGLLIIVSFLAACGLTVAGVFVLAGTGWALIAGAACLFVFCLVLARGMNQ